MLKCLTDTEFRSWLAPAGVSIHNETSLHFWSDIQYQSIQAAFPREASTHTFLASKLVGWLGESSEVALWFSHWDFYLEEQLAIVEALRRNVGENRPIAQAPAHVFVPQLVASARANVGRERAMLVGLAFLAMNLNRTCYLLNRDASKWILVQAGQLRFCCSRAEALHDAAAIAASFKCELQPAAAMQSRERQCS
jgi:hypothetical protein